jgi:hypothetical protein
VRKKRKRRSMRCKEEGRGLVSIRENASDFGSNSVMR